MSVRSIIRMGHPRLREGAIDYPVEQIGSPDFLKLIADMRETLHAYGGIGLAAPQIDVGFRIAIIEIEDPKTRYGALEAMPFAVYVNPHITPLSPQVAGYWEACLSVPGMRGYVERPQDIRVDYIDAQGEPTSKEAKGFLATVFQHEFDHLEGILYIDRIKQPSLLSFEEEWLEHHADAGAMG